MVATTRGGGISTTSRVVARYCEHSVKNAWQSKEIIPSEKYTAGSYPLCKEKETTPTSLREATPPQEGNSASGLKFPSRGGVAFALAKVGVVIIAILFATSFSAFAQPPTPITFISTGGVLSSISTDREIKSQVCNNYPAGSVALTIEGDVTNMYAAFVVCGSLKEVTINGNVNSMNSAFYYCASLEKVTINGNVTYMHGAFMDCASLKEVTINGNVTYMNNAF